MGSMSWTDDTRCLYCDGRLPLYKKITHGQFCSTAHRKAYWQEQERLAVERLHQTHHSLRAYRPAGSVEAVLGLPEPPQPQGSPLQLCPPEPAVPPSAGLGVVEPLGSELGVERPWWMPLVNTGRVPVPGWQYTWTLPEPQWPPNRAAADQPEPLEWAAAPLLPPLSFAEMTVAGLVEPLAGPFSSTAGPRISEQLLAGEDFLATASLDPLSHHSLEPASQSEELKRLIEEAGEPVPFSEKLRALPRFIARDMAPAPAQPPLPALIPLRPRLPVGLWEAAPALAGLRKLPVERVPLVHGIWADSLRALDMRTEFGAPEFAITMPVMGPRLRLAGGSRYRVETRAGENSVAHAEPAGFSRTTPPLRLPEPGSIAGAAESAPPAIPMPGKTQLQPLACTAQACPPSAETMARTGSLVLPQPLGTEMMRPASRLEPLDAKPASDFLAASPPKRFLPAMPALPLEATDVAQVWRHAVGFWNHAPRDLKVLVFAIPVLLGLALHPSLPKVRVTAPATAGGIQRNFQRGLSARWLNVKQSMLDRAAVALDEDFRSGLDDWATRGDLDASWSFDATGFVKPGPLALYRPSLGLTDYQLQFLGLIDRKALSWVVRATDFDNYYVVKLVVLKPGPLPVIGLTRYAVINGKAQDRADTTVPVNARNDMLYRVRLDVSGDDFAVVVQGQMADSWSEPRLKRGGVGFFAAQGEESRLRWVQVTHQYDMLGRLCAYLAPYNIPTTNGSW
jgi:hypothetical protein